MEPSERQVIFTCPYSVFPKAHIFMNTLDRARILLCAGFRSEHLAGCVQVGGTAKSHSGPPKQCTDPSSRAEVVKCCQPKWEQQPIMISAQGGFIHSICYAYTFSRSTASMYEALAGRRYAIGAELARSIWQEREAAPLFHYFILCLR